VERTAVASIQSRANAPGAGACAMSYSIGTVLFPPGLRQESIGVNPRAAGTT
jgi:hypothetical protein